MKQKPIGFMVIADDDMCFCIPCGFRSEPEAPPNTLIADAQDAVMFETRRDAQRAIRRTHHYLLSVQELDQETMTWKIIPVYAQRKWDAQP